MAIYFDICRNKSLFDDYKVYLMERIRSVSFKIRYVGEQYGK